MTEPDLGAGNFLDYALAANPNRDVPYAFSHSTDHRGQVVLRGHSLTDLAALRDRYARWYHANGVRPGDPVGIVVPEGLEPIIHFLALSALGAVPAMINDAMRPDIMVRYLDHVGVVGVVAFDTTRPGRRLPQGPAAPAGVPGAGRRGPGLRRRARRASRISTRTSTGPRTSWP